jgi:hypothetical protein
VSIVLKAIKFNHDTGSAAGDAINIRRNATTFVTVPEWQEGVSVNPEDSCAAYAKSSIGSNSVTIHVNVGRTGDDPGSVEVRAIDADVDPPEPGGCGGFIIRMIRLFLRALFGNVLGEVSARTVTFTGTETGFQPFTLTRHRINTAGIGAYTTSWRWQYRVGNGSWTDFALTKHRIYLVLSIPTGPWQQAPYNATNTQLPWTDVLDHACAWALTKTTPDDAAAAITQRVYALGPSIVEYDCPNNGSSHYSGGSFDCTAFIDLLKGGVGNGRWVNCSDCATFVSTFANAVGCDLWQSQMREFFNLNPILAIGSTTWETACGFPGFMYHEVAWKGACTAAEEVFDACLQVDGDPDPTTAPHTELLPTNMPFGNPGDGQYRSRLCPPGPSGQGSCNPVPATRTRRMVF